MRKVLLLAFCLGVFNLSWAVDYYVGGAGASDSNPGTATQPFATIQKAATVAKAGDVVNIRGGVYRETITPANSGSGGNPITFRPDNGALVVISGLNTVDDAGWSVHKGQIYKKSLTLPVNGYAPGGISNNTDILANQLFKDGDMMIEARWPKGVQTKEDLFKMDNKTRRFVSDFGTGVFNPGNLQDNALTQANGFPIPSGGLVGKTIVTSGWFISESRTITAHSGNSISWGGDIWNTNPAQSGKQMRKYYYLTNALEFLTQQREFHYENGTLYFWQPGGGSPTNVEYKARNWGFDLRNRSGIQLVGLTFKGCEPATGNTATAECTIDNIRAAYMNHHVTHPVFKWQGYGMSQFTGTKLLGANNVIKNSEFQWAASQGVWVGANCRVENNLFHHFSYSGMWGAPVAFWGDDNVNNIVVTKNTMYTLGRGGIDNGFAFVEGQVKNTINNEISYNDIYDFSKLNQDGGAFYSWGYQNLAGCRFHHNWIHDLISFRPPDGSITDGIMACLYFDMGSGPAIGQTPNTVDHNVFWNVGVGSPWVNTEVADLYTLPSFSYSTKGPTRIYNNTFVGNQKSYVTYQNAVADQMRNNIFTKDVNHNWGSAPKDMSNNILQGTNPQFVGGDLTSMKGLTFQITATSPARNAGVVLPGFTDGSVGAPDIGAYELGGTAWVAGYTAVAVSPVTNTPPVVKITAPASLATFAQGTAVTITATATDNSSVTRVEFYAGTTKIGEDLTAPYSFTWTSATAGNYALTAKATDDQGSTATSAVVNVTITAANNPSVVITSPSNSANLVSGTAINIAATATSTSSTITKVEFFDGTSKLGEDTSSPYSFAWNGASVGAHALTAKVTNSANATATSAVVNITVSSAQTGTPIVKITSPANNSKIIAGTIGLTADASDPGGSVKVVEFFAGKTKIGEDNSSPYAVNWSNVVVGTYDLTAKVTDNQGNSATSDIVTVNVIGNPIAENALPEVAITSPGANAAFSSGSNINVEVSANDKDGTLTVVTLYVNGIKFEEDRLPPYSFNWTNVGEGEYTLTAEATDNADASVTSQPVKVVVAGGAADPTNNLSASIPRYFSPNNDGQGDVWAWGSNESLADASVVVFNRAGAKVYESALYQSNWDGRSNGHALQDGDYYYVATLADNSELRGSVRIIR